MCIGVLVFMFLLGKVNHIARSHPPVASNLLLRRIIPQDAGYLWADGSLGDGTGLGQLEFYTASKISSTDAGRYTPMLGDYIASVHLFDGSSGSWRLTANVSGETIWTEEGQVTQSSRSSADFTVSLTEFTSCHDF